MITYQTFRTTRPITLTSRPKNSSQLNRVFAAAIINQQFCEMLLQNPHQALQNGYLGETFSLSKEERDLIISTRAETLSDLAKQVNRVLLRSQ
jgi:hypothetical protein